MLLREGSLTSLVQKGEYPAHRDVCLQVLKQILSALDYLASKNLVHRDLKPDNILYYTIPGKGPHFQLADFGLAHHGSLAKTFCGTGYFQAPELWPKLSNVSASQSSKMDVWSLFATLVAIDCRFKNFPPSTSDYGIVLRILEGKASQSVFEPMGRPDPNLRASAAQMLSHFFNGWGLTTPRSKIPSIVDRASFSPAGEPKHPPQTSIGHGKAPGRPRAISRPFVQYPRRSPPSFCGRSRAIINPAGKPLQSIALAH